MSAQSLLILYKTQGSHSFARVSTEESLEKTKTLVRNKLKVGHDTLIKLTYQLRDEESIILDDDDDFEVFKTHTRTLSLTLVTVEVTILDSENSLLSRNLTKKDAPGNGKGRPDGPSDAQIHIAASPSRKRHVSPDDDGDTLVGSSPVKPSASHEFPNPPRPTKRIRMPRKKQRV
ncbi:hypothetical protein BJV78DRAFT_1169160 [Lactifluus subvellereus]|nr:hypothetical protein BJV78DRAFT_1169160 [Lactifluus subvellereus]